MTAAGKPDAEIFGQSDLDERGQIEAGDRKCAHATFPDAISP